MEEATMLRKGKIGVVPTDTLYGVVAQALHEQAVTRVYAAKKRAPAKPCIILISSLEELTIFGVMLTTKRTETFAQYWPGPVSIILPCGADVPAYLHRGTHTLAFRLPADTAVRDLIEKSGPLIAPSANPEGLPPATTIEEAKRYFGRNVDFYLDGGTRTGAPSMLIALDDRDVVTVLRKRERGSLAPHTIPVY